MKKHLSVTIDTETTIFQKGNPYSKCNSLVSIGVKISGKKKRQFRVLGMPLKYQRKLIKYIEETIRESRFVVAFNAKFDLAWLRNLGIDTSEVVLWDCQLWEFLDSHQQWKYPGLDTALEKHGLPRKKDIIKEQYWNKGICTKDVPKQVLRRYLDGDLESEEALFNWQFSQSRGWMRLFRLQCADCLCLQEMEWNGTLYDEDKALELAEEERREVSIIAEKLRGFRNSGWVWDFNSNDDTSVFLFGGTLIEEATVCIGTFKTGARAGLPKYKKVEYEHKFEPLISSKGATAAKKEGFFLANEPSLMALAKSKKSKSYYRFAHEI